MWNDLKNKFVIYQNELLLGRVHFHKDLLPKDYKKEDVHGGGEFLLDKEKKIITLYGKSYDFGRFDESLIARVEKPSFVENFFFDVKEY